MRFKVANYSRLEIRLDTLHIYTRILSVSALIGLVTLTFDLLTSNLVRVITREVGNLLNDFDVLGLFVLDLWSDGPISDLATLTFNLGVHGACHAHGDLDLQAFDIETGALYCTLPRPAYDFITYLSRD